MGTLASGRTEREWRPYWQNDIWASVNFRSLPIPQKGIYNLVWSLCRDGEYAGCMCFPNGIPMTIIEIVNAMEPQERDRTDRTKQYIVEIMRTGMLYLQDMDTKVIIKPNDPIIKNWAKGEIRDRTLVLVVRKYAEKSAQLRRDNGYTTGRSCQADGKPSQLPPDGKDLSTISPQSEPDVKQTAGSCQPEGGAVVNQRGGQLSTRGAGSCQPEGGADGRQMENRPLSNKDLRQNTPISRSAPLKTQDNNNKEVKKYRTQEEITKEPIPFESSSLLLSEGVPPDKIMWITRKFTTDYIKKVIEYCKPRAKNATPVGIILKAFEKDYDI